MAYFRFISYYCLTTTTKMKISESNMKIQIINLRMIQNFKIDIFNIAMQQSILFQMKLNKMKNNAMSWV